MKNVKGKAGGDTLTTMGELVSSVSDRRESPGQRTRLSLLNIPKEEMTESVSLALSALLEQIDDITHELSRAREDFRELEQLVDVDCIAPVPNRRAFMRRLNWAVSMFERYNHPCSVLYFDINDFKRVNDTYGHAAGDAVIRHVSGIFTESLRMSDFMARLSGDEFGIIMYYASMDAARERGRKISQHIAQSSFMWGKKSLGVTVACGAYEVQKDDDPESALARADEAMYLDKKRIKEGAGAEV